jgi:hypothetical protein
MKIKFKGKGKVKNKIKNFVKNVTSSVKGVGGNAKLALLVPFIPMMTEQLKKRGVNFDRGNLKDIAKKFNEHVVKKFQSKHFEEVDGYTGQNLEEDEISSIVDIVLAFIKNLTSKKAEGEPMTEDEQKMLNDSEIAANQVVTGNTETRGGESVGETVKDFIFSWKGGLSLLGIILLIYFAKRK